MRPGGVGLAGISGFGTRAIKRVHIARGIVQYAPFKFPLVVPANRIHDARCDHVLLRNTTGNFGRITLAATTNTILFAPRPHHVKGIKAFVRMLMTLRTVCVCVCVCVCACSMYVCIVRKIKRNQIEEKQCKNKQQQATIQ